MALAVSCLLPGTGRAAEPEPLDEEFLEYLAELEGEADNWMWFASDDDEDEEQKPPQVPAKPAKDEDP